MARLNRKRLLGWGARTRVREAIVGREGAEAMMHRFLLARSEVPAALGELLVTNRLGAFTHRRPVGVADPDEEVALLADLIASVGALIHEEESESEAPGTQPEDHHQGHQWLTNPALEVHLDAAELGAAGDLDAAITRALILAKDAQSWGIGVTMAASTWELVDATRAIFEQVHQVVPAAAITLCAQRHRSEADAAALAAPGVRIRLVRGAYEEPLEQSWNDRHEINLAWVRCLSTVLAAQARPLLCTHNAGLLEVSAALIEKFGVPASDYEFQLWRGVRSSDQWRLADAGHQVRTIVPWTSTDAQRYDYFLERGTRRLERETFDPRDAYWRL